MTTFNDAMLEFDNNTRQQPGITDLNSVQQSANYLGEQLLRLRGASGTGFDIVETVVNTLNVFEIRS